MWRVQNTAAAIDAAKGARRKRLTDAQIKALVQEAAALLAVDETTFVADAALALARQTIDQWERTLLTAEDRAIFLAALAAPAEPSDALLDAVSLRGKAT